MYRQSLYCGFKVREWLRKSKVELSLRITGLRKNTRNPSNKRSDDHVKCSVCPWVWNPTCTRQAADCCLESSRELTTNSLYIKQHIFCNRSEVRCQVSDNIPEHSTSHRIDCGLRSVWYSGKYSSPSLSQLLLISMVSVSRFLQTSKILLDNLQSVFWFGKTSSLSYGRTSSGAVYSESVRTVAILYSSCAL